MSVCYLEILYRTDDLSLETVGFFFPNLPNVLYFRSRGLLTSNKILRVARSRLKMCVYVCVCVNFEKLFKLTSF